MFCAIRRESGPPEHPAQIDGHLLIDVFASRIVLEQMRSCVA